MRISLRVQILIAILMPVNLAWGVDFERLMLSGNEYYEQGDFDAAILEYEQVLAADGVSASLHYNLGCAYFNKKVYGKAILHFEKARQLDPRDSDILHNLEFGKLFLKDRFELPKPMPLVAWFSDLRQSLSLAELRFLEKLLFCILIIFVIIYRFNRARQISRVIRGATFSAGLLFLFSGGWLIDRVTALEEKQAVLLVKEANISSAPIPGSSTLFVIHEGTSAQILDATDTWYEIRLADGKTGWIKNEAVGIF
ncbi:tetratricopeptide repeat protein [bacterium]|nr:tetratricopeptide repeat protein [bacterium]